MSVEHRLRKKGMVHRVKRLEGDLTATFTNQAAAELQDKAWGRWGARFPLLADQQPTLPVTLRAKLLSKKTPELTDELLAEVLSYHPPAGVVYGASASGAYTIGEYIVDRFFDKWKTGKLPGGSSKPKPEGTWMEMERALNKIVFELEYEYDDDGNKLRDEKGNVVARWGAGALAHLLVDAVTAKQIFALDQRVKELGIGLEVWRKVRGFLRQMFAYARLDDESGFPIDRPNPVDDVPPPKQSDSNARRAYLPPVVEGIRADFYYLAVLSREGIRRVRGGEKIWTPGVAPAPAAAGDEADHIRSHRDWLLFRFHPIRSWRLTQPTGWGPLPTPAFVRRASCSAHAATYFSRRRRSTFGSTSATSAASSSRARSRSRTKRSSR